VNVLRLQADAGFELRRVDLGAAAGFLPAVHPTRLLMERYLGRSMVDGSRAAASLFDHMVELAEQWIAHHHPGITADPRAYAAVLVAMQTGLLMMHDHLSRALGADILSPEGNLRMSRGVVDFYSHALLSPDLAAQAHAAYDRLQAQRPPTAAQPRSQAEGAPR
jgi:TetR/AcrR family transcriptional regulator, regulator of cefoperazone and chloramphenicol sensitivity